MTLDGADVSPVQSTPFSQLFLGKALLFTKSLDVLGQNGTQRYAGFSHYAYALTDEGVIVHK